MNKQMIHQEFNEKRYSRKHIDHDIRAEIEANPVMVQKWLQGVALIEQWMHGTYYESKMERLNQLMNLDIEALVMDIFVGIAYVQKEQLFTSVTAQLAGRLRFSDRTEAIQTVAEMVAVLCRTDAFDILKASRGASLVVVSQIPLSVRLLDHIETSQYLPPMVCEPQKLTNNFSSGYLTHNDSLILGNGNHHEGDICLDVLNIMNSVPLSLATDLLCQQEEEPSEITVETMQEKAAKKGKVLSNVEAQAQVDKAMEQWGMFKKQSYRFYKLMVDQGNRFYICNKVDKRGRIYSVGYHISPQGAAFKKAILELADKEVITDVPIEFRINND